MFPSSGRSGGAGASPAMMHAELVRAEYSTGDGGFQGESARGGERAERMAGKLRMDADGWERNDLGNHKDTKNTKGKDQGIRGWVAPGTGSPEATKAPTG